MLHAKQNLHTSARAYVLVLAGLVHVLAPITASVAARKHDRPAAAAAASTLRDRTTESAPPQPVIEMVEAILAAVRARDIEELRTPLEWNELPPDIAETPVDDPIAYWRSISVDGEGRDILSALGGIIGAGHAVLPLGRDIENNLIYVWPYFAERPLDTLSAEQQAELAGLVGEKAADAMRSAGRYTGWRLAIGAEGTWHSFRHVP